MQQFSSLYVVLIAIGGALVALAIYHAAALRPAIARMQALVAVHDDLISGGAGGASERLAALENADVSIQAALEAAQTRVATLEAFSASDVSRCGFVRYDAFADAESGLSYALALLNRQGNGVVLTSIYSRADTRTYGKPVEAFKPTIQASAEELEAIERARAAAS
ncbi:MAG TPA: DUF4446 family protein [Candidatus Cybelea sp.]|nr:DUF4446 family protein [Candidatus Cybelea sp.]